MHALNGGSLVKAQPEADAGLALVRLNDFVRRVRQESETLAAGVENYDPTCLHRDNEVQASAQQIRELVHLADELLYDMEVIHDLAGQLKRQGDAGAEIASLHVASGDVIAAAARWLEQGIADRRQIRLAAQLLPPRRGLLALARALETTEHPAESDAPIRELIGGFFQMPATVVDQLEKAAAIDFNLSWKALTHDEVARLATVLRLTAEAGDGGIG
jgi:hypothetical protein